VRKTLVATLAAGMMVVPIGHALADPPANRPPANRPPADRGNGNRTVVVAPGENCPPNALAVPLPTGQTLCVFFVG
jgi:hypothetical protein